MTMQLPTPQELEQLGDDDLVTILGTIADELDEATSYVDSLFATRLATFQEARSRTPAVTQKRLAEASRITEPAVIQQLRKHAQALERAQAMEGFRR